MSKSNKHHCTPDLLGEQKGDFSPFFHIQDKETLKEAVLKERKSLSFLSEEELQVFSTFLHAKERGRFFKRAAAFCKERQALANDIHMEILSLSEEIAALAHRISMPREEGISLRKSCAQLAEQIEKGQREIRTNILNSINNKLIYISESGIFVQIEREFLLLEAALTALGIVPADLEQTKRELLSYPPQRLAHILSQALEQYRALEGYLASQIFAAAKVAKEKNTEKYSNILHEATVYLYDTAGRLKAIEREEI